MDEWTERTLDKITEGERPPLQVTGGFPLDLYVPSHLRQKILSGKFINLADLLEKDPTKHGLSLTKSGLIGQPKNNRITTFEQWDEAWSIYITVFSRKEGNPEKLPTLVKHRMNVITVKQKNGFWMDYDKQFCLLKWHLFVGGPECLGVVKDKGGTSYFSVGTRGDLIQVCIIEAPVKINVSIFIVY